jgi:uncharacterized membrane protein YcaP (DUF421 family)
MAIIFFRTIIIFLTLLIFMRLLGKRQLGELELNELVVSVLVANLASLPLQDIGIPLLNGVLPVIILFCCEILISGATLKSVKLRALVCGKPALLIANGVINQKEMQKNRFTLDELTEQLRSRDIMDIAKVKYAILETDGTLNAILYAHEQPVKATDIGVSVTGPELPSIVINNGRVMAENLRLLGRDERWLSKELSRNGCAGAKDVYLMTLSPDGEIYLAKKETAK